MTVYIVFHKRKSEKQWHQWQVFTDTVVMSEWLARYSGTERDWDTAIQRIDIDPVAVYQSADCRKVDVNGEPVIDVDEKQTCDIRSATYAREHPE